MTVPENLREAIREQYNAEDVKVIPGESAGGDQVYAYGMLPGSTIVGWFPLGDLDELEAKLRDGGEL